MISQRSGADLRLKWVVANPGLRADKSLGKTLGAVMTQVDSATPLGMAKLSMGSGRPQDLEGDCHDSMKLEYLLSGDLTSVL